MALGALFCMEHDVTATPQTAEKGFAFVLCCEHDVDVAIYNRVPIYEWIHCSPGLFREDSRCPIWSIICFPRRALHCRPQYCIMSVCAVQRNFSWSSENRRRFYWTTMRKTYPQSLLTYLPFSNLYNMHFVSSIFFISCLQGVICLMETFGQKRGRISSGLVVRNPCKLNILMSQIFFFFFFVLRICPQSSWKCLFWIDGGHSPQAKEWPQPWWAFYATKLKYSG